MKKLQKEKFTDLRMFSKTSYEEKNDYYFIKKIEKKEKDIINDINTITDKCSKLLRNAANEEGFKLKKDLKDFYLPKIKFKNIIKIKKKTDDEETEEKKPAKNNKSNKMYITSSN